MPRKTTPKLSAALAEYLSVRATHIAPSTYANDRALLRKFVNEVGDRDCHLLTARTAESWFAQEATRQLPSSYNKTLTRVRGFLAFCTRRGWLLADPLTELRPRSVARRDRLRLSADQALRLIQGTKNPRDRAMLALGMNTGLRASDICALTIGDARLSEGFLRVTIQKTGDYDELPVTQDLDQELRDWLRWYAERLAVRGMTLQPSALLFPALGHSNVYVDGRITTYGDPQPERRLAHPARVVQRALVRIGITETKGQGFHTLRRSVGRLVFEHASEHGHDAALRIAAAQLGHKSVTTTELYLGLRHDRVKRDQLLRGQSFLSAPASNVTPLRQAE